MIETTHESSIATLFIKGLVLDAIIGVYSHEREKTQPLILDVEMRTDIASAARSGDLANTVDYDLVIQRITHLVSQSQFALLESLIHYVADSLLTEFSMQAVTLTIYKPNGTVKAKTVGITLQRVKN